MFTVFITIVAIKTDNKIKIKFFFIFSTSCASPTRTWPVFI